MKTNAELAEALHGGFAWHGTSIFAFGLDAILFFVGLILMICSALGLAISLFAARGHGRG
jgi:Trk-type K+ transport system membrane component